MFNPADILKPVFAMVVLTFTVMMRLAYVRLTGVQKKEVHPAYFKVFQGDPLPERQAKPTRNIINLFEVPVLFYVAILLIFSTQTADSTFIGLAWAYFAFRAVHSLIHLTFNHIYSRFAAFALSNLCLAVIWVRLGILFF